jgi:type II secretory pathway component PulF
MHIQLPTRRMAEQCRSTQQARRDAEAARTARLDALLDAGIPLAEAVRIVNH